LKHQHSIREGDLDLIIVIHLCEIFGDCIQAKPQPFPVHHAMRTGSAEFHFAPVTEWLSKIGDDLHAKLAEQELCKVELKPWPRLPDKDGTTLYHTIHCEFKYAMNRAPDFGRIPFDPRLSLPNYSDIVMVDDIVDGNRSS
jgi:hypothetical protein